MIIGHSSLSKLSIVPGETFLVMTIIVTTFMLFTLIIFLIIVQVCANHPLLLLGAVFILRNTIWGSRKTPPHVILRHIGLLEADEDKIRKIRPKGTLVTILYVPREPICPKGG